MIRIREVRGAVVSLWYATPNQSTLGCFPYMVAIDNSKRLVRIRGTRESCAQLAARAK